MNLCDPVWGILSGRINFHLNDNVTKCEQATGYAFEVIFVLFAKMGCAASKRMKNARKDALHNGAGYDRSSVNLCNHRQDVNQSNVPVIDYENDYNSDTSAKINDKTILDGNNSISLIDLDETTKAGEENDGFRPDLTNMDVNGETVTNGSSEDKILILHFNDVYNIEPREKEPVGGAARFASKIATFKSRNPLTLFSGDALNPSMSELILFIITNRLKEVTSAIHAGMVVFSLSVFNTCLR